MDWSLVGEVTLWAFAAVGGVWSLAQLYDRFSSPKALLRTSLQAVPFALPPQVAARLAEVNDSGPRQDEVDGAALAAYGAADDGEARAAERAMRVLRGKIWEGRGQTHNAEFLSRMWTWTLTNSGSAALSEVAVFFPDMEYVQVLSSDRPEAHAHRELGGPDLRHFSIGSIAPGQSVTVVLWSMRLGLSYLSDFSATHSSGKGHVDVSVPLGGWYYRLSKHSWWLLILLGLCIALLVNALASMALQPKSPEIPATATQQE